MAAIPPRAKVTKVGPVRRAWRRFSAFPRAVERRADSYLLGTRNRRHTFWKLVCFFLFAATVGSIVTLAAVG